MTRPAFLLRTAVACALAAALTGCGAKQPSEFSNGRLRVVLRDGVLAFYAKDANEPFARLPLDGFSRTADNAWSSADGVLTVSVAAESPFAALGWAPAASAARKTVKTLAMPSVTLEEKLRPSGVKTLGTEGLLSADAQKGSYGFLAVAEPHVRRGVVFGWLTSERGSGVLFSEVTKDRRHVVVRPVVEYGCLVCDAGAATRGETLLVGAFEDARLGLEAYADAIAAHYAVKLPPQPSGYCTWYADRNGKAGDEGSTKTLADQAKDKLAPWGFDFIQIDDGWQAGTLTNGLRRNFAEVAKPGPYANGLKPVADHLATRGLRTGLWFLPFAGEQCDPAFTNRLDLFVRVAADGAAKPAATNAVAKAEPAKKGYVSKHLSSGAPAERPADPFANDVAGAPYATFWGGTPLDFTNPKTGAYLTNLVARFRDWGVTYLKGDALYAGLGGRSTGSPDIYVPGDLGRQAFADPKATNLDNLRLGLGILRKAAGTNVFVLACHAGQNLRALAGSYGLVDAMRIGPDNAATREGLSVGPRRGTPRYFYNGRVWYNDPDPVYVRNALPLDEARFGATWTAISGQLFTFADWLPDLAGERLEILRRTMAPHRMTARVRPVDLFESDLANAWVLGKDGTFVFGLFNWDAKKSLAVAYSAAFAGLDPAATYVGFDFWKNAFIAPFKGRLKQDLDAGSCRVLQVRALGDAPVLVSTSRHVASPLFDVREERWNFGTLEGTSEIVPNENYELRFVMPEGWTALRADGVDGIRLSSEGQNVRVAMTPKASPACWRVTFLPPPAGQEVKRDGK